MKTNNKNDNNDAKLSVNDANNDDIYLNDDDHALLAKKAVYPPLTIATSSTTALHQSNLIH
jgi:hypothetical protein